MGDVIYAALPSQPKERSIVRPVINVLMCLIIIVNGLTSVLDEEIISGLWEVLLPLFVCLSFLYV